MAFLQSGICAVSVVALGVGLAFGGAYQSRNIAGETILASSDHFEIRTKPTMDDGSANTTTVKAGDASVQTALDYLENAWTVIHEGVGFREPFAGESVQYKTRGYVFGASQLGALYGGEDSYGPGLWFGEGSLTDKWGLAHEYTHGLQSNAGGLGNTAYAGWIYESHANWMAHQVYPSDVHCSEDLVNYPYLYYGSTRDRYCNWQYLEYFKDYHENGGAVINSIWSKSLRAGAPGQEKQTFFTALQMVTGWSLAEMNRDFGTWAVKNVTWDYKNGETYRKNYGSYEWDDRRSTGGWGWNTNYVRHGRVTIMNVLDSAKNRYISPDYWAPQRYGYNLVRIYPNQGVKSFTVKFRGLVQKDKVTEGYKCVSNQDISWGVKSCNLSPEKIADPGSSWEVGLVAVGSDGKPRYSEQYSGTFADISMDVYNEDKAYYLVVTAAPKEEQTILWDQFYYTIYRYPYMVETLNSKPESYQEGAWIPADLSGYTRHENGGGYVSSKAKVASSVYVGQNAVVNGGTVSGNARIEDHAVINGGTISGDAVVRGRAFVTDGTIGDNAVLEDDAWLVSGSINGNAKVGALTVLVNTNVSGFAQIYGVMRPLDGKTVGGNVQLRGDLENNYTVANATGVYYGIIGDADLNNTDFGNGLTAPPTEATASIKNATWWEPEGSTSLVRVSNKRLGEINVVKEGNALKIFLPPKMGSENSLWEIALMDACGKVLQKRSLEANAGSVGFPLENLPRGTYFMVLRADHGIARSIRFIK